MACIHERILAALTADAFEDHKEFDEWIGYCRKLMELDELNTPDTIHAIRMSWLTQMVHDRRRQT